MPPVSVAPRFPLPADMVMSLVSVITAEMLVSAFVRDPIAVAPPSFISGQLLDRLDIFENLQTKPTSKDLPGGTSTVCTTTFDDVISRPATCASSTLPPSLPMISLVIANLNPRDLMQLARIRIEVVIPRDRVRNVYRFAHA